MNGNPDIFDQLFALPALTPLKKHRSVLLYIFFGALTTIVSIGSFVIFDLFCHELLANFFSWVFAVTFAYITSRCWVFQSRAAGARILPEAAAFFAGRLATLVLEEAMLLVFVTRLQFNSTLIKVLAQVVVLVLNYLISKLLVFRKK